MKHQVKNALKSGRAKIVFIAPDFEDSEALDEKLEV
jgi:ribosomal protein L7Ae-like RNA K-turn-binding protein